MLKKVKLPEISESAETAIVTEILISEGDHIEKEQSIIIVETDKASVEIPSSESGTVKELKVSEGDEVETGTVILTVETEEEAKKAEKTMTEEAEAEEIEAQKEKEKGAEKTERRAAEEKRETKKEELLEATGEKAPAAPPDQKVKEEVPAAPSVRRLARELGIDIYKVEGTGPGDRITSDDVKAYAREMVGGKGGGAALPEATELPDFSRWGEIYREPLSNIRKTTARNTARSWRQIPHVTHFDKADMELAEAFMEENADEVEEAGGKLTITALLVKLAAVALEQFPAFNASLDMKNEEIIYKKYFHIGLAVDTHYGLLVPVIHDVDKKSIMEIAAEITGLAEKARNKKLSLKEMQGGNFIVTNLGGIGGTNFTPIIFHPQVAILGVSRAATEAVYDGGEFKPRRMLPLSLSYDHRLIDGATAARFLRWLCEALENPLSIFLEKSK
jgi:pyruvate dehydrogenase E2 component (dihydrolipoamide acetyltransferase)